jgi:conjugative relaxase-like TrwC/TraI family protein
MVASIGKGTVAQYYLRRTEYYLTGQEPVGVWLTSSPDLGIAAGQQVEADIFEKLHAGLGPDGKPLSANVGGGKKRVSGYDLTLSAPKSVSILFALADAETRAAIERVQYEAAQAVVAMLNQEAAFIRRGHNGLVIQQTSLIVAAFQHGEARPAAHSDGRVFADMDLHSHLCIANLGRRNESSALTSDEQLRYYNAIDGRAIYAAKMLSGSYYHLALSSGLQKLGFDVRVTSKNGICEVFGPDGKLIVDDDTKRYFSARRSKIEERLAEYDLVTGEATQLAAAVGKATRLSKSDSTKDRFELWREVATERGIDCSTFATRMRSARMMTQEERAVLIAERLADLPLALTEQESVFERRTLLAAVSSALVGTGADTSRINAEADRMLSTNAIVKLGQDIYGHGLYSTPDMIAIEKRLQTTARKLSARKWTSLDQTRIKEECRSKGLSVEQQHAVLAATDGTAISICEGAAGAGKTLAFSILCDQYKSLGKTVLGGAISWRTCEMIHESLGINAYAIDSLLARIDIGQQVLNRDTVLVIDECGQIGSRAMDKLLTAVANAHAKVVFIGDSEQLQPINAGAALKILTSEIAPARIETIIRQRDQWARDAARAFAKGDAAKALALYAEHDLIRECAGAKETIRVAVDDYLQAKQATPDRMHLLIAKSNKTVRALNSELRRRMRDAGELSGPDHAIEVGDASGRPYRLALAVGDKIRFGIRQDTIGKGVINGTTGNVTDILTESDGHLTVTAMIHGDKTTFSTRQLVDKAGRVRLGHDLAVTAYSSQGLTAETATVILDASYDRNNSYVSMSRARGATRIVFDAGLVDSQDANFRPFDQAPGTATSQARLSFLAGRISGVNLKTSTLGMIEPKPAADIGREKTKTRRLNRTD